MIYYHNPNCTKSRLGLQKLQDANLTFKEVRYIEQGLTEEAIREILFKIIDPKTDLVRTKEAKEAGLSWDTLDDDTIIRILMTCPKALQRPILVTDKAARIGRPPEHLDELL